MAEIVRKNEFKIGTGFAGTPFVCEALTLAGQRKPEIVVLDVGMPKLDGCEVARRIRDESWGRGAVLVALTGWGQEVDRRRSREAGFDMHLVKPVDPAALCDMLVAQ